MTTNDLIILDNVISQQHGAKAPDKSAPDFFELFVAEQVLKNYDLSYEELEVGIVGNGGDGGIDALYTFANGELIREDFDFEPLKKNIVIDVYILQAKRSDSFGESPIDRLIAVTGDLFDLSKDLEQFKTVYNDAVRSAAALFRRVFTGLAARFPTLRFHYIYATRGADVHPNTARKVEGLRKKVKELFSSAEFHFEFLGAPGLLALARRRPVTSFELILAENPISSAGEVGYICLVKLRDFVNFLKDDDNSLRKNLFEANVRDYQGTTEVNEAIQASLATRAQEDFWWLNNGVTIVASKATQSGKTLTLEDPQIVNGLQTSTEIHHYFTIANTDGDERNLLVRVIVPSKAESRDRIIKATNSQTSIPPASLRATDKIHRDIEEYLKTFSYFYDRRKNSHKNEGRHAEQIVSIPLMAQAVMAIFLQRPDDARARPSSLIKKDADYNKLFATDHPLEIYRLSISVVKKVDAFLKTQALLDAKDRNNLRFYVAMHAAACLAGKAEPNAADLKEAATSAIDVALIQASFDVVYREYVALGATDQIAKGTELLQRLKADLASKFPKKQG